MRTYNIHDAKTHYLGWWRGPQRGAVVIAKAGKPMVKVIPLNTREPSRSNGSAFMAGQISVPTDFDQMGEAQIMEMFEEDA